VASRRTGSELRSAVLDPAEPDALQVVGGSDVGDGVAADEDQVRAVARLDHAAIAQSECRGGPHSRGSQRLDRGEHRLDQEFQFVVQAAAERRVHRQPGGGVGIGAGQNPDATRTLVRVTLLCVPEVAVRTPA
jgi:hypothetical protein